MCVQNMYHMVQPTVQIYGTGVDVKTCILSLLEAFSIKSSELNRYSNCSSREFGFRTSQIFWAHVCTLGIFF